jgi:hypothetical protein
MEIVSIVIQHPLNAVDPVVKGEFQFRLLKVTQEFLNASKKIFWPGELLSCQCRLHVPERTEVRTVRRMGYPNNQIFSEKVLRGF